MSTQHDALGIPAWSMQDRLRKALNAAGVGVQEMADHLEVSRVTVGNYLAGRTNPTTSTLRVWAMRCGVPYLWLTTGEEPKDGPDGGGGQVIDASGWFRRSAAAIAV